MEKPCHQPHVSEKCGTSSCRCHELFTLHIIDFINNVLEEQISHILYEQSASCLEIIHQTHHNSVGRIALIATLEQSKTIIFPYC